MIILHVINHDIKFMLFQCIQINIESLIRILMMKKVEIIKNLLNELEDFFLKFIDIRLAVGPRWELPSHQDLVPSWSWHRAGTGPGAPISQRFDPIPSHEKKF